jgi:hypothetical protein
MISVTKVASGELITASPEAYAFLHFRCIQRIYCSKKSIALYHLNISKLLYNFLLKIIRFIARHNNTIMIDPYVSINKASGISVWLTSPKSEFSTIIFLELAPKPTVQSK